MNAKSKVTKAMEAERRAKEAVRVRWVSEVRRVAELAGEADDEVPWYLTLAGAEGLDVLALMKENVIGRTEVDGVPAADARKVVAIESSEPAVATLLSKIPGLKVLTEPVNSLVRGEGLLSWPEGEHRQLLRARVVNLDLNAPLKAKPSGTTGFPVVDWIRKFAILHGEGTPIDWTLCLTLHASIDWPAKAQRHVSKLMKDNLDADEEFHEGCIALLGEELTSAVTDPDQLHDDVLGVENVQVALMTIVPKLIARAVAGDGWVLDVQMNARYGKLPETAPMVTWIVRFKWQPDSNAAQNEAYRRSVRSITVNAQRDPLAS